MLGGKKQIDGLDIGVNSFHPMTFKLSIMAGSLGI
jgi:hypothetical protein